jgi:hypothetical protein
LNTHCCQESQKEIEKLQVSYEELKESCQTISRHTGNNKVPKSPSMNKTKAMSNAFREERSSYFTDLQSAPHTQQHVSTGDAGYEEDNTLLDELDEDNGVVPPALFVDARNQSAHENVSNENVSNETEGQADNFYDSLQPSQNEIVTDIYDTKQEVSPLSYVVLDIDLENNLKDQLIVTIDSDPMVGWFLIF